MPHHLVALALLSAVATAGASTVLPASPQVRAPGPPGARWAAPGAGAPRPEAALAPAPAPVTGAPGAGAPGAGAPSSGAEVAGGDAPQPGSRAPGPSASTSVATTTSSPAAPVPAGGAPTPAPGPAGPSGPSVSICVGGTRFCVGGSVFIPYGASFYSSTARAGIQSDPAGAVALARTQHLNTVRVVNWLSHNLQAQYSTPLAQATSDQFWTVADTFVADAEHAGLHAWLDLSDFKNLLLDTCTDPYAAPQYPAWDAYVRFAAQRVNPRTGLAYGRDPDILWVGFSGEPYPPGTWGPGPNPAGWPAACPSALTYTTAELTAFFAHVEATWKRYSATLTMAGGLGYLNEANNGIDYRSIFANPDNDICGFKTYGGMEAWLATGTAFCATSLHKPSVNVEWGYQQTIGDAARAADFQAQFDNNAAAGIAANFYWNAGYQVSPTGYDVDDATLCPLTVATIIRNAPG